MGGVGAGFVVPLGTTTSPTGSSGNVVAALRLAEDLEPGSTIVTFMCDTGMKYLSSDLFRQR